MPQPDLLRPDFYIAAIGRSGSTMLCDFLTLPPGQIVLSEPFFFSELNPTMLRIQLENLDYPISDEDWRLVDPDWRSRFNRLFRPFLSERRWAFKEVLAREHDRVIAAFRPRRIVISVRDIRDIAASFLEKHKAQHNVDRFDHQWVADYCTSQSKDLLAFVERLNGAGPPMRIQRYEDFTSSDMERDALAAFVGWEGGGLVGRHHSKLSREFEVHRHGNAVNSNRRAWADRDLTGAERRLCEEIEDRCGEYQRVFNYR